MRLNLPTTTKLCGLTPINHGTMRFPMSMRLALPSSSSTWTGGPIGSGRTKEWSRPTSTPSDSSNKHNSINCIYIARSITFSRPASGLRIIWLGHFIFDEGLFVGLLVVEFFFVEYSHSEGLCIFWCPQLQNCRVADEIHDDECSNSDQESDGSHKDENYKKRSLNKMVNTWKLYLFPIRLVAAPLKTKGLF